MIMYSTFSYSKNKAYRMARHNHVSVEHKIAVRLNSDLYRHNRNYEQSSIAHWSHSKWLSSPSLCSVSIRSKIFSISLALFNIFVTCSFNISALSAMYARCTGQSKFKKKIGKTKHLILMYVSVLVPWVQLAAGMSGKNHPTDLGGRSGLFAAPEHHWWSKLKAKAPSSRCQS